jgi:hypothetical protein
MTIDEPAPDRPWHPRPLDVPIYRDGLLRAWSPDGSLTHIAPMLAAISGGHQKLIPPWEHDTTAEAALWFVGADMCDLLVGAAPTLPAVELHPAHVPDLAGLVVFGKVLAGIDAENLGVGEVNVAAMVWGPARWETTGDLCLGITCYGPPVVGQDTLLPLGGLIWPFGRSPDDPLADETYSGRACGDGPLTDVAVASMVEDRRRLLALWLLSTQAGLATSTRAVPGRAAARRAQRSGRDAAVRVVQLRHQPPPLASTPVGPGRSYHHRWAVAGHWRNQAYGPKRGLRRPTYINPHLKGPEGAPLIDTPKVKAWTR